MTSSHLSGADDGDRTRLTPWTGEQPHPDAYTRVKWSPAQESNPHRLITKQAFCR